MICYDYLRPRKAEIVKRWYNIDVKKKESLFSPTYENATILPAQKISGEELGFGRGGVLDGKGNYVEDSGLRGRLYGKYDFTNPEYRDQKVVYCGYMVPQWGHFLVEGVTRLWYFLENDITVDKYVFFLNLGEEREIKGNYREMLELLGIWDKVEFINQPTQYREVIVPEKAFSLWEYWSDQYKEIFRKAGENIDPKPEWKQYQKIFLSRSRIPKFDKKEFNMDMLDDFFSRNGFEVFYPEHHSLSNLVYVMQHAEVIATLSGSVQHNMMFAPDGVKHIIIEKTVVTVDFQVTINQMKQFDVTYIDANLPIYPVSIGYGPYIMRYSGLLRKFAEDHGYQPADPSFEDEKRMRQIFRKYMKAYRGEYQYQWYLANWEQQFIAAIREGYEEGLDYFRPYLTREKPFAFYQYFLPHYWKRFARRMLTRR